MLQVILIFEIAEFEFLLKYSYVPYLIRNEILKNHAINTGIIIKYAHFF